jgi:hypothetical protein
VFGLLLAGWGWGTRPATDAGDALPAISDEQIAPVLADFAIPFEENRGQSDSRLAFQARSLAGPLFVTRRGELVWSLSGAAVETPSPHRMRGSVVVQTR